MSDDVIDPPVGASVWAREMYEHLARHGREEGEILAEYVRAAEDSDSRAFSYLVDLLVEDEHRHHRVFDELARALKADAELDPEDSTIPRLDFHRCEPSEILAVTERLLQREKTDQAELKRLRKDLRDFEDTTLWTVLVEMMEIDTQKHIKLLEYVREHASKRRI